MGRRGAEVGENLERAVLEVGRRTLVGNGHAPRPRGRRAALLDGFALIRVALKHAEWGLVVERTRVGAFGFRICGVQDETGAPWRARDLIASVSGRSVEPSGSVREHGVDLAGLRGEIGARHRLAAIVARDLLEQPLELADVAVDGALEIALAAIFPADFLE